MSKRLAKLFDAPAVARETTAETVAPHVHKLRQRLSSETIVTLVADYTAGMSAADLQQKYVLGKGSVLQLLHEAGVPMRRQGLGPDQLAVAIEHYQAGLGTREVAAELRLAKTTVQNALARAGVEMRPGGRRRRAILD